MYSTFNYRSYLNKNMNKELAKMINDAALRAFIECGSARNDSLELFITNFETMELLSEFRIGNLNNELSKIACRQHRHFNVCEIIGERGKIIVCDCCDGVDDVEFAFDFMSSKDDGRDRGVVVFDKFISILETEFLGTNYIIL